VFRAALVLLAASIAFAACQKAPPDPLQLNSGLLTVDNRTADEWRGVEIWVNHYYRATTPSIAAGARFTVSLDSFVDGYGRRFDRKREMIKDLRLKGTAAGAPLELVKALTPTNPLDAFKRKQ
jgi:hypothetical protein